MTSVTIFPASLQHSGSSIVKEGGLPTQGAICHTRPPHFLGAPVSRLASSEAGSFNPPATCPSDQYLSPGTFSKV